MYFQGWDIACLSDSKGYCPYLYYSCLGAAGVGWGSAVWDAKEPLKLSPKDWVCFIRRSTRQRAQDDGGKKRSLKMQKPKTYKQKTCNRIMQRR